MALEAISKLFARGEREGYAISDVQHGIEVFLQRVVRSEDVYCRVFGTGFRVDIRTRRPALAQVLVLSELSLRDYAKKEFGCSLGGVRVILEW